MGERKAYQNDKLRETLSENPNDESANPRMNDECPKAE
jgi:hypothetical protein